MRVSRHTRKHRGELSPPSDESEESFAVPFPGGKIALVGRTGKAYDPRARKVRAKLVNGSLETLQGRQVQEFMTMNVTRIEPAQSLKKICQEMKRHNIHHLPVVDDGNKLVGIVSAFDVVKAIAENG